MAAVRKVPQRQCVGCGISKDKRELMRVIRTAESEILLDDTGKKNGRGAYICKSAECLKKALKNKGLERSLKIRIPDSVYEALQKEMERFEAR